MFGVVLWSNQDEAKAVIWCEDHGDLAFYNGSNESVFDGHALDAGDLVSFDLSEGRDMRVATDPKLVAEAQYSDLADRLMASGGVPAQPRPNSRPMPQPSRQGRADNVIAFAPKRAARRIAS